MARRKKHSVKRRRHHRVGAFAMKPTSPLVMLGGVAVGYLAGTAINSALNMLIPASMKTQSYTGKAVAAVEVGVGALLLLGKGPKSMIKSLAGGLLAGAGLKRAMTVFAPGATDTLGGYGDVPVIGAYVPNSMAGRKRLNGYGDIPVVGGVLHTGNNMGAYVPNSAMTGANKVMGGMGSGLMGDGGGCMQ